MQGYSRGLPPATGDSQPAMRKRNRLAHRSLVFAAATIASLTGLDAGHATTQIWDPSGGGNSGGNGDWDTTSKYWDSATGTTGQTWSNSTVSDALFNGSAGTVNVSSGGISVENTTFGVSDYTINSSNGGILTLYGSTPTFKIAAVSETATLNAVLAGSAGAVFVGASSTDVFNVDGLNTYTGSTVLNQVSVAFNTLATSANPSSFGTGSGSVQIATGGSATIANYVGTGTGTTDRLWTVGGGSISNGINTPVLKFNHC